MKAKLTPSLLTQVGFRDIIGLEEIPKSTLPSHNQGVEKNSRRALEDETAHGYWCIPTMHLKKGDLSCRGGG